ncbi:SMODS domain-containing nucleotidyltransferase, partial [Bacillus sp. D-CC]
INFEIVPAFINNDGSYKSPDTNEGGSWRTTDPRREINAIHTRNSVTNKNLKRLCRMACAWKSTNNIPMSGILIDTLVYKFIDDWPHKDKSSLYYDFMSRDFFEFLKNIDKNQLYWLAPGSNRYVWKYDSFQNKAFIAYNLSLEAIEHETNNRPYSAKQKWREIYGTKFSN